VWPRQSGEGGRLLSEQLLIRHFSLSVPIPNSSIKVNCVALILINSSLVKAGKTTDCSLDINSVFFEKFLSFLSEDWVV